MKQTILIVLGLLVSIGCSTTHVMVGQARPPTSPDQVKVYFTPPAKFEEIALVGSDSKGTLHFTDQGKIDAVLQRLKEEAASLGANGIIIQGIGEKGAVTVGSASVQSYGNAAYAQGFSVTRTGQIKTISAIAIWVQN